MRTSDKVAIDRLIAKPMAWGFTGAARVLGRVLRRDHSVVPDRVRTIVVAKLLGIGSIIQATPLLHALRSAFPNARLIFLTSSANRQLVERLPAVDESIYIDDRSVASLGGDAISASKRLARLGIDLYFDLEVYSAGASLLALASLARNRYGFYRHSARFKKGNYTHLIFFNVRMPVGRLYLQLCRAAGGPPIDMPELGPITVAVGDIDRVQAKLSALGHPPLEPYFVINPNASDLLLERRWPLEHFAATIEALIARGYRIVLIGAPKESPYVHRLHDCLSATARAHTVDSAGKLELADVFALIQQAQCVITNDTGPMHISIALKRPTVCLFGPGSPDHYGTIRPNVEILYKPVVCSPCIYETDTPPCAGDNTCMKLIRPEEVVDAALRLVAGEPLSGASSHHLPLLDGHVRYTDSRGHALGLVARSSLMHRRDSSTP